MSGAGREEQEPGPGPEMAEEGGDPKGWFANEHIPRWIGATSAALASIGILVTFGSYLIDRHVRTTTLEVSSPEVIELRCSTSSFKAEECWGANDKMYAYLSVTGAFRLTAKGPDVHEVAIVGATAEVHLSVPDSKGKGTYRLRSFWSGDLTGSARPNLKQIVPTSLKGGQSVSQEIWFFPLSEDCSAPGQPGDCRERQNFRVWHRFVADLAKAMEAGVDTTSIAFTFETADKHGYVTRHEPVTCTVLLGNALERMLDRFGPDEDDTPKARQKIGALAFTLPCREFQRSWRPEKRSAAE